MAQQIVAIAITVFFLYWVIRQYRSGLMARKEFILWVGVWALVGMSIVFIRQLDGIAARFGLSASGIDLLVYVGLALSFYLVVRLRLRIAKIERQITVIVRELAVRKHD